MGPASSRRSRLLHQLHGVHADAAQRPSRFRVDDNAASLSRREHSDKDNRLHFLDNLKTFVILLVVLCHSGWVYESSGMGAYFWIVDDPATNDLSGLLNIILDILMMPTLFFISGYLAPVSLKKQDRLDICESQIDPAHAPVAHQCSDSSALVQGDIPVFQKPAAGALDHLFPLQQRHHQSKLAVVPSRAVCFNMLYLLLSKAKVRIPNVSVKGAILATFLTGFVYSVCMDMFGLQGWTKNSLLNFQNERLLIYFTVFLLGVFCCRRRVFDAKPKSIMLYLIVNAIAWIPVTLYIVFLLFPWFRPGQFIVSETADRMILWFNFHLSLLCLMYLLIETFRRYQNTQGKFRKELNKNSYYVYIIHVIVLGSVALGMMDTAIPSLWKYVILTTTTFVVSNVIISLVRSTSGRVQAARVGA